ncbi:MAG: 3-hydroxyacyl-CoA dehydrogenase family protein [Bacteroidales bacterium]|nr:3-hydroxyacyl-CoA dehydrogenase family protein [Bacteroidales bacterium]
MSQLSEFTLGDKIKPAGRIHSIGIVGCGSVGQEIALLVSRSGLEVVFVDVSKQRIKEIFSDLESQLDNVILHWGMTPSEKKLVLSRIRGTTGFKDLGKCEIVIETISSRQRGTLLELRQELFEKIEKVVASDTIISSHLATLMISDLASVLKHPGRAIGIHFLEPIAKTRIVEVVKGNTSDHASFEKVLRFVKMIGRKAVVVNEAPGNISTRMIIPIINEACELLMEGVASVHDIDMTMREIMGNRNGPFEMADKIGLDKILKYMDNLYAEYGDRKYKASPVIKRLVRANYLGRDSGKGFYNYEKGKQKDTTIRFAEIE